MAEDDSKQKKRRIIRTAETLREKAERSKGEQAGQAEKKRGIVGWAFFILFWPLRFVGRQLAKLERFKVFRIIGYILVPPYFRNSFKELQQVTWPNRKETLRLTGAVLAFATVFGILVTAVDYGLEKIFKRILLGE